MRARPMPISATVRNSFDAAYAPPTLGKWMHGGHDALVGPFGKADRQAQREPAAPRPKAAQFCHGHLPRMAIHARSRTK
jgi:hypothetical protein